MSKVIFSCDYELDEQIIDKTSIKINWLFSSTSLVDQGLDKFLDKESKFQFDKNRLIILSYDPLIHSGQYRCLLNSTTNNLVLLSLPANLTQAKIDSYETNIPSSDHQIVLSEGNVAIIPCKLPASNPPALPIFYFNDQQILESTNSRFKIFPSGNLQISNLKPSDSGVYRCSARNLITNELKQNPKKTILKVFEPFGTKLPEIVYAPIDTNRVQQGGNLTLECVANGAPVPLVSWEKFGGVLPEKRSTQIFGNLIITNLQPEDKGTYVCRAENGPGQATFKTAMIDVFESPSLVSNLDFKYSAKKGDSIDLKCPIRSRPRADVQWFYQGKLITTSNRDKSILTIHNFMPGLSGVYQCFAQNEYGSIQANLYLTVEKEQILKEIPKRPVIIMGPQNTTIYEGQSVVLLCVTSETSSGNAQINWLQNDLIIEPTLMRRFEINQLLGNLRIVSVQKSDAGVYKCIASNEFGMSTAEAYVNVKSHGEEIKKETKKPLLVISSNPQCSRPSIQQIGEDRILLKWNLLDPQGNLLDLTSNYNIAYFKVEYKTNKQQIPGIQPHTWLTIDEQIDPKKREYILTDLNRFEIYRFRISTFFLNGELNHSHQSAKFKLESTWSSTGPKLLEQQFKLSQIQVQITQIWAISSSSLGLKWNVLNTNQEINKTNFLLEKINGFYIYYRKLSTHQSVPLYNYTRINVPISLMDSGAHQIIDTYLIANLEQSTQYEIKMTCYNLNGDLCSFSNTIYGLTLITTTSTISSTSTSSISLANKNVVFLKSRQNEILFMILGVVLGVLTLLLIIFVVMCLIRHRQHRKLLAQLHNTSHKLTSSSCPTLIYEDSLRQTNRLNTNLFIPSSVNDSNSTNSQSMSTTTSSMMTTPPADTQPSHILLLNGNTVSTASMAFTNPPPVPQVPPPTNTNSTLNRININLNPLNGYLEGNTTKNQQENFYHTLTQLGTLPDQAEYSNATLNMRHLILQQQQQQQLIMNTLKNINLKQQLYQEAMRSPSVRRNTSFSNTSSKKGKKSKNLEQQTEIQQAANYYLLPQQQQQQNRNFYNEVDLLQLEQLALLNHQPIYLLNPSQIPFLQTTMDLFEKQAQNEQLIGKESQMEMSENNSGEQEPMLANHYATSGVLVQEQQQQNENGVQEERQLL